MGYSYFSPSLFLSLCDFVIRFVCATCQHVVRDSAFANLESTLGKFPVHWYESQKLHLDACQAKMFALFCWAAQNENRVAARVAWLPAAPSLSLSLPLQLVQNTLCSLHAILRYSFLGNHDWHANFSPLLLLLLVCLSLRLRVSNEWKTIINIVVS